MNPYDDPPAELRETLRDMELRNQALLNSRQYSKAQKGYEEMYKIQLANQPSGKRYHKGHTLHNIGVATFYSGKPQKALTYFLLAYVEDLLFQSEDEEDKADILPAGKTLSEVYLIDNTLFTALKVLTGAAVGKLDHLIC